MPQSTLTFNKLFLKYWKIKKRKSVGPPDDVLEHLRELKEYLEEKKKNKGKGKPVGGPPPVKDKEKKI